MRRVFCGCSPLEELVPPPGFEFPSQGPFNQETFCAGVVLAVLRAYGPGAEKSRIAQWSGLDQDHVEEALRYLKAQGYAERQTRRIPWYYGTREAHFWVETPRRELLGRPMPRFEEPPTEPDGIPPRFWWVFLVRHRPNVSSPPRTRLVCGLSHAHPRGVPTAPVRRDVGVKTSALLGASEALAKPGLPKRPGRRTDKTAAVQRVPTLSLRPRDAKVGGRSAGQIRLHLGRSRITEPAYSMRFSSTHPSIPCF